MQSSPRPGTTRSHGPLEARGRREGDHVVVNLVTHPDTDPSSVAAVAEHAETERAGGVIWTVTDRLSDVVAGETRQVWEIRRSACRWEGEAGAAP